MSDVPRPVRFSIVIPWHRNRENLRRAVASAMCQSHPAHEIIIVCNGPGVSDVSDIKREFGSPVIVLARPAADANAARNCGIDAASGDYVAFLDADDEFLPQKLEMNVSFLRKSDAPILCSRGVRSRSRGVRWIFPKEMLQPHEGIADYVFVRGNFLLCSSIVVQTQVAQKVHFREKLGKFQDTEFLIRAQLSGFPVRTIPSALFIYHDEDTHGRLSRNREFDLHLNWASESGLLNRRTRAAFLARAVAQHEFPRKFATNLKRLVNGWWIGGIPAATTISMACRGLIPNSLREAAFVGYTQLRLAGSSGGAIGASTSDQRSLRE